MALGSERTERARIAVLAGPTACGKTELAVELAKGLGAEIVGADSMQVYRGFDIGTAKPRPEELRGATHHLIDVADPEEPFDAARYLREADAAISAIAARGARPLVVGGTGLYIRALLYGLHGAPGPDERVRGEIAARAAAEGWPALHAELSRVDPKTAARLHPNDGARILRALEVARATGIAMSEWQGGHGFKDRRYDALLLGITRPREELFARVERRVDAMMADGFLEEVSSLLARGVPRDCKPMNGLGYKWLAAHLSGEIPLSEAVEKTKTDTRRFAKRQLTWFRGEAGLSFVSPEKGAILGRMEGFFGGDQA